MRGAKAAFKEGVKIVLTLGEPSSFSARTLEVEVQT
jgi:hypothetical protein